MENHDTIKWVGNCNELCVILLSPRSFFSELTFVPLGSNAAYAADGYARVKQAQLNIANENEASGTNGGEAQAKDGTDKTQGGVKGLAALLTTYGVGELSAVRLYPSV